MKPAHKSHATARPEYRLLAGVVGSAALFVGLPVSVWMAIGGTWDLWSFPLCCLIMGYGFVCVFRTGQMFVWRGSNDHKDT
jgi:hypothetical protein